MRLYRQKAADQGQASKPENLPKRSGSGSVAYVGEILFTIVVAAAGWVFFEGVTGIIIAITAAIIYLLSVIIIYRDAKIRSIEGSFLS